MTKTTDLARWIRRELQKRELTQNQAAVYAGVAPATISEILNKEHIPKVETLFRLADYLDTSREQVLRLAGHLPPVAASDDLVPKGENQGLVRELLDEFYQVPDEWKPMAIESVAQFRRLAELQPVRFVGEAPADEVEGSKDVGTKANKAA
jgi:transcriptional regulator with XRE-family HTH domain